MAVLYAVLLALFALYTRLAAPGAYPGLSGHALLCREQARSRRRLPVRLPGLFSLDSPEQYAPPGWPVLLALLPDGAALRRAWAVAPLLEAVFSVCMYGVLLLLGWSASAAFAGGLCFALAPVAGAFAAPARDSAPGAAEPAAPAADADKQPQAEDSPGVKKDTAPGTTKNAFSVLDWDDPALPGYDAPLGLKLLLALGVVLPACIAAAYGLWWPWLIALVAGCAALFTSFSGLACLALGLSGAALFSRQWELAALTPCLLLVCIVASAGFYARMARCRWALLRFLLRLRPARPRLSPRRLLRLCLGHADVIAAAVVLCVIFSTAPESLDPASDILPESAELAATASPPMTSPVTSGTAPAAGAAETVAPVTDSVEPVFPASISSLLLALSAFGLLCGAASFILCLLGLWPRLARDARGHAFLGTLPCLAALWALPGGGAWLLGCMITLLACARAACLALRLGATVWSGACDGQPGSGVGFSSDDRHNAPREALFAALADIGPKRALTWPPQLGDAAAWRCRVPVCWGGHAAGQEGLARLGLIWPLAAKSLPALCRELEASHLCADTRLCPEGLFADVPPLFAAGPYRIWAVPEIADAREEHPPTGEECAAAGDAPTGHDSAPFGTDAAVSTAAPALEHDAEPAAAARPEDSPVADPADTAGMRPLFRKLPARVESPEIPAIELTLPGLLSGAQSVEESSLPLSYAADLSPAPTLSGMESLAPEAPSAATYLSAAPLPETPFAAPLGEVCPEGEAQAAPDDDAPPLYEAAPDGSVFERPSPALFQWPGMGAEGQPQTLGEDDEAVQEGESRRPPAQDKDA